MMDNRVLLLKLMAARKIISELMEDPGVRGELKERLGVARKLVDEVFDELSQVF
jgi:predicted aminopeptidase